MRYLLLLVLCSCVAEVVPEDEVESQSQELICSPMNEYTEWLRDFAKVPREWCSVGPYFLPDDEQVQAAFCAWYGSHSTLYRGLGIRRQGLDRYGTMSYDTFACSFRRCDIYIGIVTCSCNGCSDLKPGTQQYYP